MELSQLVGLAGAPLVQALTEWTKKTFPKLRSRWYPSISVAWGIVLNEGIGFLINSQPTPASIGQAAIVGVATGLFACGLFAWGKKSEKEDVIPHV